MNTTLILKNGEAEAAISTKGGHIEYLCVNGANHLWDYDESVWPRRTSVCFPICGSVPQNQYRYANGQYFMEPHGFTREMIFEVSECGDNHASLCLRHSAKTLAMYPFEFEMYIHYRLESEGLRVCYEVTNSSESSSLYYSIGSHYTYAVPIVQGENSEDYRLLISGSMSASCNEVKNGLLNGSGTPVSLEHPLSASTIDERAIILHCDGDATTRLTLANTKTGSTTTVSFSGFNNCVLWAPYSGAPFVCIEPWAGMTGRIGEDPPLDSKDSILCLEPGRSKRFEILISTS